MSKIAEFRSEKSDHNSMANSAYTALNIHQYYRSNRDKHGLEIGDKRHDRGEPMGYLTGWSGYYGDSGCSYEATPRMAKYLRIVINKRMEELIEAALILSAADVEKKRIEAKREAKEVLKETDVKP